MSERAQPGVDRGVDVKKKEVPGDTWSTSLSLYEGALDRLCSAFSERYPALVMITTSCIDADDDDGE